MRAEAAGLIRQMSLRAFRRAFRRSSRRAFRRSSRRLLAGFSALGPLLALAQPAPGPGVLAPSPGDRELQRLQEEARHRRESQASRPDVRLPAGEAAAAATAATAAGSGEGTRLPEAEASCRDITRLLIEGDPRHEFDWLRAAADRSADGGYDPATPRCLGGRGIAMLMARLQNALVARSYVTSRVVAPPQDLKADTLTFTLVPGRVHALRLAPGSDPRADLVHAFPLRSGDLLNLRALEQGLENLRRLPSVTAEIEILPAEPLRGEPPPGPGDSDLLVHWRQGRPLRGSLTLDDGGSRANGQLQGSLHLAWENPAGLNDLLQLGYQHDLEGQPARLGLRGYSLAYSVPLGHWSFSASGGEQRFHQRVVGNVTSYVYSGYSRNAELGLQRLLRRDASSKSHVSLSAWTRASGQFIDDTEVEVQRRRTAGWTLGLDHRHFFGPATLDLDMAWRQGTGAAGALPAPEAVAGDGVSRPRILTASAQLDWPLPVPLLGQRLRYGGQWRAQWSEDPLVPLDRFTIGGRYTVRGFDGEAVLQGQRGWLLRNELGLALGDTGQEVFLGLDHGRVSGAGAEQLVSPRLTGAVLGWRGGLPRIRVEVFASGPISQPPGFHAPLRAAGFSLTTLF